MHADECVVSFFRPKREKSPIKYIQFIHKKLFDICQQSGLEGLKYYGGPICKDCKDDGKIVVLRCVEYGTEPGTNSVEQDANNAEADPICDACSEKYSVNELLLVCTLL